MAKSGFWLRGAKGKFAGASIYRGKTGTIMREIVPVTNPKTNRQMLQRGRFANAVKFFKHAQQAFFRFAFERKKQGESDYNAFVRYNMQASLIFNKEANDSKNFPAIGNEWMLTQGSLPNLDVRYVKEYVEDVETEWPVVVLPDASGSANTIGELSKLFIDAYKLNAGDIITLVYVNSNAEDITIDDPGIAPYWDIKQFKLDETDERTIGSVLGANVKVAEHENIGLCLELAYVPEPIFASGAACVVSRVTPNGTLVGDSYLRNNSVAKSIAESAQLDSYVEGAIASWGAKGEAILQGSLVQ